MSPVGGNDDMIRQSEHHITCRASVRVGKTLRMLCQPGCRVIATPVCGLLTSCQTCEAQQLGSSSNLQLRSTLQQLPSLGSRAMIQMCRPRMLMMATAFLTTAIAALTATRSTLHSAQHPSYQAAATLACWQCLWTSGKACGRCAIGAATSGNGAGSSWACALSDSATANGWSASAAAVPAPATIAAACERS
jgi:hypothetical protein